MSGNDLAGLLQAQILHSAISPRNQTALTKRKAELLHADFLDLRHGRLKSEAAVMVLMNQDPLPRPRGHHSLIFTRMDTRAARRVRTSF
jgi:hypothetical protein